MFSDSLHVGTDCGVERGVQLHSNSLGYRTRGDNLGALFHFVFSATPSHGDYGLGFTQTEPEAGGP